jgi:ArsR family transcriptional regulator
MNKELFKLQAEICKTMANPKRLHIIYVLKEGEKSAGEIADELGVTKANASQQLAILKSCGVVNARRDGVNIYYSISNPKIVKACALMREVLTEEMQKRQNLINGLKKSG